MRTLSDQKWHSRPVLVVDTTWRSQLFNVYIICCNHYWLSYEPFCSCHQPAPMSHREISLLNISIVVNKSFKPTILKMDLPPSKINDLGLDSDTTLLRSWARLRLDNAGLRNWSVVQESSAPCNLNKRVKTHALQALTGWKQIQCF